MFLILAALGDENLPLQYDSAHLLDNTSAAVCVSPAAFNPSLISSSSLFMGCHSQDVVPSGAVAGSGKLEQQTLSEGFWILDLMSLTQS